jgi:hypothetical protein
MRLSMSLVLMALMAAPALGDDVPYAAPSPTRLGSSSDTTVNSLSDIMGLTQLRHIKLWYAGRQENWPLTRFELKEIEETFGPAAMFYRNIPVDYVTAMKRQLDSIQNATKEKDSAEFAKGFAGLTDACNTCHKAAQVGFIVIQTPTASPFSDQKF